MLGLRAGVDTLSDLVRNASDSFPGIPGRDEMTYRLRQDVEDFLRHRRSYNSPSEWDLDHHNTTKASSVGTGRGFWPMPNLGRCVPPVSTAAAV